uniref:Hypothetical secreted peptide n=1 Tax=Triatoma matogrossensis TaxID=162370 RepID=E2J7C3_9HEMI
MGLSSFASLLNMMHIFELSQFFLLITCTDACYTIITFNITNVNSNKHWILQPSYDKGPRLPEPTKHMCAILLKRKK